MCEKERVCVYMRESKFMCVCVSLYVREFVCEGVCMCESLCLCVCERVYVRVCVSLCVFVCVYMSQDNDNMKPCNSWLARFFKTTSLQ